MYALSHVVVLAGISLAATQPPGPVEQDADPMQVMEEARELAENGQHEEALAKLLWCFDYGAKESVAFTGVRFSFLLSRIAEFGNKYPPALEALQERREAAERRAGKTKGTHRYMLDLMELAALNQSLGEDAANLELNDELKSEVPESPILGFMRHFVADEHIKAGRADKTRALGTGPDKLTPATPLSLVVERKWPRDLAGREKSSSVRLTTAYSLDNARYEKDLAATRDEAGRLEVLKQRWYEVVLAVTYCDVVANRMFLNSVRHWQSGWLTTGTWTIQADGDLLSVHNSLKKATVLVKGDCRAEITVGKGRMVHIYGDLRSNLTISGLSEVVIGGDITKDGVIENDGILRVFVGGNVDGRISSKSSSILWINGDVTGTIYAGDPRTEVHVIGDFVGQFLPLEVGSMAYLDVRGNMPSELIEKTARYGWIDFNASVGSSDAAPGLYGLYEPKSRIKPKSYIPNSRWVVLSQRP